MKGWILRVLYWKGEDKKNVRLTWEQSSTTQDLSPGKRSKLVPILS